jgi:hypothetical protein
VECANLGAYGALWLLQFVLCDRVLFPRAADASNRDAHTADLVEATSVGRSSADTR